MDKEIMDILKTLLEGQRKLEDGQRKLEDGQRKLEDGQKKLEDNQKKLEDNQKRLDENQKNFESKLDETYQIVKALKHSAEVNRAEHDKMANDIIHIKGDVEAIKKDLSRVEEATASNWVDIARLKAIK